MIDSTVTSSPFFYTTNLDINEFYEYSIEAVTCTDSSATTYSDVISVGS